MKTIDTRTHKYTALFADTRVSPRICALRTVHLSFLYFFFVIIIIFLSHLVSYPHINCFCCHCAVDDFTMQRIPTCVWSTQNREAHTSFVLAMPIVRIIDRARKRRKKNENKNDLNIHKKRRKKQRKENGPKE